MTVLGNCKVCPRNCKWNIHKNVPYICEIVEEEVIKTNKDLEEKYYSATNQKRTKEMMIDGLGRLYGKQQMDILNTVSAIRENISELKVSFCKNKIREKAWLAPTDTYSSMYVDFFCKNCLGRNAS